MGSALLACMLHAVLLVVWRHLQPTGILFYQGLLLAFAVTALQLVALRRWRRGTWGPALKDCLLGFLLIYSLLFTVPTTVERAYTVRMVLELQRVPQGLTRPQIELWFATEFQGQGGVERRLREQMATGSLVEVDGHYRLTPMGQALARTFVALRRVYASDGVHQ